MSIVCLILKSVALIKTLLEELPVSAIFGSALPSNNDLSTRAQLVWMVPPHIYRLGAVEYKYIGMYLGCYKEEGQVGSLRIRVSRWSLHPDPQRTLPLCRWVPASRVDDAESLSRVATRTWVPYSAGRYLDLPPSTSLLDSS